MCFSKPKAPYIPPPALQRPPLPSEEPVPLEAGSRRRQSEPRRSMGAAALRINLQSTNLPGGGAGSSNTGVNL